MKFNEEDLREFWRRDRRYREEQMLEKIELLIKEAEMLKHDLERTKKEMSIGKSRGNVFSYAIAKLQGCIQRFNIESLLELKGRWDKANEIIHCFQLLELEKEEG